MPAVEDQRLGGLAGQGGGGGVKATSQGWVGTLQLLGTMAGGVCAFCNYIVHQGLAERAKPSCSPITPSTPTTPLHARYIRAKHPHGPSTWIWKVRLPVCTLHAPAVVVRQTVTLRPAW